MQNNAVKTAKKISAVYGDSAIAGSIVLKWFSRFGSGNVDLGDQEHSARIAAVSFDQIETVIKNNPAQTTRDIVDLHQIFYL